MNNVFCEVVYLVKVFLVLKLNGVFDILYSIFCFIDMFILCVFWIWYWKCMFLLMLFDIVLYGFVFKIWLYLWSFLKGFEVSLRNGIIF